MSTPSVSSDDTRFFILRLSGSKAMVLAASLLIVLKDEVA